MKKMFSYDEVREDYDGCVMIWIDKENGDTWEEGNAWESMAISMMCRYVRKVPYIKRVVNGTNYDGTRYVKFYETYGVRIYQYID